MRRGSRLAAELVASVGLALVGAVAPSRPLTRPPFLPPPASTTRAVFRASAPHEWDTIFQSRPRRWFRYNKAWPYNGELEFYRPQNVRFTRGGFVITAAATPYHGRPYVSARLTTRGRFAFTYGRLTIVARYPVGRGVWPAIWLRPTQGGIYPEIDVAEYLGQTPTAMYENLHTREAGVDVNQGTIVHGLNFSAQWVTYTLIWTPDLLQWQVNHRVTFQTTRDVPTQPMFLVINMAIGGSWPGPPTGAVFPQRFAIRSVVIQQLG